MNDDKPFAGPPGDETQPVRPIPAQHGLPAAPPAAAAGETPAEQPATATTDPTAAQPGGPTAAASTAAPAIAAAGAGRRGFRDRLGRLRSSDGNRAFGLAALIASALAGVIIGGLGVTAVQAVTDDHHDREAWMQRGPMDRDGDDLGGRGPMHGAPPGMPGQVQPTTPPKDEDGSAS